MTIIPFAANSAASSLLQADLDAATRFLTALDATADAFTFQVLPDKRDTSQRGFTSVRHAALADATPLLLAANRSGSGVFVTVNAMDGTGGRRRENFRHVRAIWAELDGGLPDRPWPLAPSIVVQSSPGKFHVYWLIAGGMDPALFSGVMSRLVADWGADHNACDLTRVLRVPGFWHQKGAPTQVTLVECHPDRRYPAVEIAAAFPPISVNDNAAAERPRHSGTADVSEEFHKCQSALQFLADKTTIPLYDGDPGQLCADDRSTWIKFGMALKREFADDGFALWDAWSQASAKYDPDTSERTWASFTDTPGRSQVTLGSIYHLAKHHGWERPVFNPFAAVVATDGPLPANDGLSPLQWAKDVTTWTPERVSELMQRMGRTYSFIEAGAKYVRHDADGTVAVVSSEELRRTFSGVYRHGHSGRETAFNAFEAWPGRAVYRDIGFYPGSVKHPPNVPEGHFNTWTGLAVEPVKGDWSLYRSHLHDVICGGNSEHYEFLMDWMAQAVQQPQRKPGCAVTLVGSQKGSGKSTVSVFLRRIFGPQQSVSVSQMSHITGNFNGHLEHAVFVGVEEGFWAGNRQAAGVVKDLITADVLTYENKGRDSRSATNCSRLMFTSNEARAVYAERDERRHFVLEVVHPQADKGYFDRLYDQMDAGGLAAFLYDLMEREITSDFYRPPTTQGLLSQRLSSLSAADTALLSMAEDGIVPSLTPGEPDVELSMSTATNVPTRLVADAIGRYCDHYARQELARTLGHSLAKVGVEKDRRRAAGGREYVYRFPPLPEFREAVSAYIGLPVHGTADHDECCESDTESGF